MHVPYVTLLRLLVFILYTVKDYTHVR